MNFQKQHIENVQEQVVDSLPPYEESPTPVYNQVHREQIVASVTTENIAEIPVVQEHVSVQEIPEVSDVVRTQDRCSFTVFLPHLLRLHKSLIHFLPLKS